MRSRQMRRGSNSRSTFMILMRFWLGLVACAEDGSFLCRSAAFCRQPTDAFGDHFLCCDKYEFHSRHTAKVESLHFIRAAGQQVANEVGVAGRERPADLFLERWYNGRAAAVDVTVAHRPFAGPICPGHPQRSEEQGSKQNCKISAYFC